MEAAAAAAPDRAAEASQHATATSGAQVPTQPRRRTTITTPTGQWALGKTIGAGSMGKVKLAKNMETGEQVSQNLERWPPAFVRVAAQYGSSESFN